MASTSSKAPNSLLEPLRASSSSSSSPTRLLHNSSGINGGVGGGGGQDGFAVLMADDDRRMDVDDVARRPGWHTGGKGTGVVLVLSVEEWNSESLRKKSPRRSSGSMVDEEDLFRNAAAVGDPNPTRKSFCCCL